MAQYETRVERVTRTTLVLPERANWAEVHKAFAAARTWLRARNIEESDDAVWVVAYDDEIRIELPEEVAEGELAALRAKYEGGSE